MEQYMDVAINKESELVILKIQGVGIRDDGCLDINLTDFAMTKDDCLQLADMLMDSIDMLETREEP